MWSEEERWVKDTERKQRPDIARASEKVRGGKERKGQEREARQSPPPRRAKAPSGVNRTTGWAKCFHSRLPEDRTSPPNRDGHVTADTQNRAPRTTPLEPIPDWVSTQTSLFGQRLFREGKQGERP